jgi:hypothetical protein
MSHRQLAADTAAMCDQRGVNRAVFIGEKHRLDASTLTGARPAGSGGRFCPLRVYLLWSRALRASLSTPDPKELGRTWFSDSERDQRCLPWLTTANRDYAGVAMQGRRRVLGRG